MIVYIEGVDGSGKTTLIENMSAMLRRCKYNVVTKAEKFIPTRPNTDIKRVPEDKMYSLLYTMLESDTIFILDRGPISDIVYRVFDDYEPVTKLDKLAKWIKLHNNLVVIYCKTDMAEQNMLLRGDDNPVALQHHKELSNIYDIVMTMIPCIRYDYTKSDLERIVTTITTVHRIGE